MTDTPYLPPKRLQEQRDRLIEALTVHFANDHLDTTEFENRLDQAYRATSLAELQALQADLPALADSGVPAPAAALPTVAEGDVRDQQVVAAIMGSTERRGEWVPVRQIHAVALMGSVCLDFREARFTPGVTEVNVLALMGGVEIRVPPGVRVESNGIGIMGGFESRDTRGAATAGEHAPTLRIRGMAMMGGVEVVERLPGETARDARRRIRDEQKQRRRLRGGG